jgi:hypothetical protein
MGTHAMIVDGKFCSNCGKRLPFQCDGVLYNVPDWPRQVCKGSDGESFESFDGGPGMRIVMGHGISYTVPLSEVK